MTDEGSPTTDGGSPTRRLSDGGSPTTSTSSSDFGPWLVQTFVWFEDGWRYEIALRSDNKVNFNTAYRGDHWTGWHGEWLFSWCVSEEKGCFVISTTKGVGATPKDYFFHQLTRNGVFTTNWQEVRQRARESEDGEEPKDIVLIPKDDLFMHSDDEWAHLGVSA